MCVGVSDFVCVCVCVCLHRIAIMYIIICCASSCLLSYTRRPEIVKMPRIDWVRDRDRSRNSSTDRDRQRERDSGGEREELCARRECVKLICTYRYICICIRICICICSCVCICIMYGTPTAHPLHTHTPAHTRTHIVREIAKGRCHACLCMRMFIIMCASLASPRAVELVGEHCSASSCSPHPLLEGERVMMLGLGSCPFRSSDDIV